LKLHEYQSKALLRDFGVAVPEGHVATTADEARESAAKLFDAGSSRVAVKAQVHAGGRGKGGGIKLAASADEAAEFAAAMLGSQLVTPQTGPDGVAVNKVYIEAGADIANELYVALTLDRSKGCPAVIASAEGGMDIEEVAASNPDAILREHCEPGWGLRPFQATRLAYRLGLSGKAARGVAATMMKLSKAYRELDASLAEINPLVITGDDSVIALDAKFDIDDNALYRHPELAALRDSSEEEPLEMEAAEHNLSYVALDGTVGCMVNGAGLAMGTMDEISNAGGFPANFQHPDEGRACQRGVDQHLRRHRAL